MRMLGTGSSRETCVVFISTGVDGLNWTEFNLMREQMLLLRLMVILALRDKNHC
jgi:hypothetical protein